MPSRVSTALLGAAAMLALGGGAQAQSFVRPDCAPLISERGHDEASTPGRWYRRFWTGECQGLRGCMAGSPNWNDVVGKLVARSTPATRAAVLTKACRLGPTIGVEWSRPKPVRKIDTGDLMSFKRTLDSGGDVLAGLEKVEAQARAKLASPR